MRRKKKTRSRRRVIRNYTKSFQAESPPEHGWTISATPVSPASWCCGWKTKETLNHATRNSTRRCNPRSGFQCFYFNLQITESAARSLIDSDRFLLSRFLFPQNSKSRVVESLDRKSTRRRRKRESTQANCDINSKRRFKRAPERKRIDSLLIRQIDKTKIQNCKGKSKTEVQKRAIRYW
jgi:hypothetical protein